MANPINPPQPRLVKQSVISFLIIAGALLVIGIAGTKLGLTSRIWQSLVGVPAGQENYLSHPQPSASTTTLDNIVTIYAAGDIASCDNDNDQHTADILKATNGQILTLGDSVYDAGRVSEFTNCFHPTWGAFKERIKPAVGNHEYITSGASGYFNYFGSNAGELGKGYYSFDYGQWHLIALNSNCSIVNCGAGSAQAAWLSSDLSAHKNSCTLAYMHHPRFSSGLEHGNDSAVEPLWQLLYDNDADVVLAGHEHNYERFSPQTPSGTSDTAKGIREFVVGTGGRSLYGFGITKANSQIRDNTSYGVLKMTLLPSSYYWEFLPAAGYSFTDSGSDSCH